MLLQTALKLLQLCKNSLVIFSKIYKFFICCVNNWAGIENCFWTLKLRLRCRQGRRAKLTVAPSLRTNSPQAWLYRPLPLFSFGSDSEVPSAWNRVTSFPVGNLPPVMVTVSASSIEQASLQYSNNVELISSLVIWVYWLYEYMTHIPAIVTEAEPGAGVSVLRQNFRCFLAVSVVNADANAT